MTTTTTRAKKNGTPSTTTDQRRKRLIDRFARWLTLTRGTDGAIAKLAAVRIVVDGRRHVSK